MLGRASDVDLSALKSDLPVVLGIEVVEDLDFGVGVNVGGEFGRENLGENFVDPFGKSLSSHVLEEHFGFTGGSLAVFHGDLMGSKGEGDHEGQDNKEGNFVHGYNYKSILAKINKKCSIC